VAGNENVAICSEDGGAADIDGGLSRPLPSAINILRSAPFIIHCPPVILKMPVVLFLPT